MIYDKILDELLEWLHNNTDKPLRIADIAAKAGYSPWHLQRIFKSYTGVTLGQYVTELKLKKAFELLATTKKTNNGYNINCWIFQPAVFFKAISSILWENAKPSKT